MIISINARVGEIITVANGTQTTRNSMRKQVLVKLYKDNPSFLFFIFHSNKSIITKSKQSLIKSNVEKPASKFS